MLPDVDPDLLLSYEDVTYEDADSSILGSGGFGKVSVSPLHCTGIFVTGVNFAC